MVTRPNFATAANPHTDTHSFTAYPQMCFSSTLEGNDRFKPADGFFKQIQTFRKENSSSVHVEEEKYPNSFNRVCARVGVVDSPLAQRGLCLVDRVPVRGPLLPRVRHLDPVRVSGLHQSPGPGCSGQQPPHRGAVTFTLSFRRVRIPARFITMLLPANYLQVNVGHPSEVDEIFDAISYSKGASVIRMLHNYIGDEVGGHEHTRTCTPPHTMSLMCSTLPAGLQERNERLPAEVPAQKCLNR